MSIPRDILDQLLSGYLDDSLSGDERTQVERFLNEDPSLVAELAELRKLREDLQLVGKTESSRLSPDFSQRVVEQAIQQAITDQLPEDHPLVLAGKVDVQQVGLPRTASASNTRLQYAIATAVAIAASIGLAIFLLKGPDVTPERIAENVVEQPEDSGSADSDLGKQLVENDHAKPSRVGSDGDNTPSEHQGDLIADGGQDARGNADTTTADSPVEMTPPTKDGPAKDGPDVIVAVDPVKEGGQNLQLGNKVLFAFLIRRTEAGRANNAVSIAMKNAGIQLAENKKVSAQMVGAVADELKKQELGDAQVMYLELLSTKVDMLTKQLIDDVDGIESVGYTLIATPAVQSFVASAAKSKATEIRSPITWDLQGDAVGVLFNDMQKQSFIPMKKAIKSPSNGPSPMSQILVLIQ